MARRRIYRRLGFRTDPARGPLRDRIYTGADSWERQGFPATHFHAACVCARAIRFSLQLYTENKNSRWATIFYAVATN